MSNSRVTVAAMVAALSVASLLAGCGSDDDPATATDDTSAAPAATPAAPGTVRTRLPATVMDIGTGPELCLGPIAESYPPQCSGPAVDGWRWSEVAPDFERQGPVRWGSFAVTGTWDGTTFTLREAVPGASYDAAVEEPAALPEPSRGLRPSELEDVAAEVATTLPDVQSSYADQSGHVLVDVLYDDGTLQDWADTTYGEGVVVVTGALVDA